MKLSNFTVLLIWATLSIAGLAFLPLLRVQWQPSRTLPSVSVSFSWPNVSGRVIEQEATSLLEGGLNRIRGIRKITSTSRNGNASINIEFDKTVDMDATRFEVASTIRQLYPKLPDGVSFPSLYLNRPNNENERAVLIYSIHAPANPSGIQQYAKDQLEPVLAQIDGVSRIEVTGAAPYEWMIEYDSEQLQAIGLTPSSLDQAIKRHYRVDPLGMVQDVDNKGHKAWMQLTVGDPGAHRIPLEEVPLQQIEGRIIRIGDIAAVRYIEREPTSYFRINGMNTINMRIFASSQANHIVVAQSVKAKIAEMESSLPKGYSILKRDDTTEHINRELNKIYIRTVATICILLLFILIVTRKFRFLMIILLSIISNICIALGMYYLLRVEIHLYSLAGITISLGLIIDNAIVMVEHIRSRGNQRVFMAIIAATVTTVISLSAIFFLDERIKLDLADFAIVVIINLMVSMVSAWFLTPALYGSLTTKNFNNLSPGRSSQKRMGERKGFRRIAAASRIYASLISGIQRRQWIVWTIFVLGFGLPVFMLPNKIEGKSRWAEMYNKTLGNQWYVEKGKPIVDKIFGGSLRLFVQFVYEGSRWNSDRSRTTLNVTAHMPPGATIAQMNQSMEALEQYLSDFKEIDLFLTNINNAQNARISITFKKEHEFGYFPFHLQSQLISKSISSGAADWSVSGVGQGFSNRTHESTGSYRIQLFGYNYDQLYEYADDIRKDLLDNARIKEVNIMSRNTWEKSKNREFILTPDIERLAMSGISLPTYYNMVRNAAGNEQTAAGVMIDGTYRNVKYRAKQLAEIDQWSLYNQLIHTGNTYLKLSVTGEMKKDVEQMEICKENQQYTMFVSYDYVGSSRFGSRMHDRIVKETNEILPLGYRAVALGGNWGWRQKDKKQYLLIVLILIVMYIVFAILFESLWQPLAVISLVPFGFIGLFLTFYLFRLSFNQGGFAALVLLCGLTVNAAIYIINDYNSLKNSPCSSRRIYMQALHGKITPVMLTILSTILGLIPFVVGEHREPFWFPLAAGTMGGLLFSLAGILFYLPLFFFRKRKR